MEYGYLWKISRSMRILRFFLYMQSQNLFDIHFRQVVLLHPWRKVILNRDHLLGHCRSLSAYIVYIVLFSNSYHKKYDSFGCRIFVYAVFYFVGIYSMRTPARGSKVILLFSNSYAYIYRANHLLTSITISLKYLVAIWRQKSPLRRIFSS